MKAPLRDRSVSAGCSPSPIPATMVCMNLPNAARLAAALLLLPPLVVQPAFGWGADGHRMINRLAGAALPPDVPAFLRSPAALDALEYYGPEPDRWKSPEEPELAAAEKPNHYIDLEYADLIGPLPRNRYDYIRALEAAQPAHPNLVLTAEKIGMQPYAATEVYQRLENAFRDYRTLLAAKQNTKPCEAEIVFYAGWLGHYVGDGSQPLHTTFQYDGWTGPNPHGYTTAHGIHARFEITFVHANVRPADVAPLVAATRPVLLHDVFVDYLAYLRHSNSLVEQFYQLDKQRAFNGSGTPAGKAFADQRLAAAAIELRNLIYTAWIESANPVPGYQLD